MAQLVPVSACASANCWPYVAACACRRYSFGREFPIYVEFPSVAAVRQSGNSNPWLFNGLNLLGQVAGLYRKTGAHTIFQAMQVH